MNKMTKSQENYIKTIYELSRNGAGARISDIAAKLEVTKASASVGIKTLQEMNLIRRDEDRLVYLTSEGVVRAKVITGKFSIIRDFLSNVLLIDEKIAHDDACAMEHVLSTETLCVLCRMTGGKPCSDEGNKCLIEAEKTAVS